MFPSPPFWLCWLSVIALILHVVASTLAAFALDITIPAATLLMLETVWHQQLHNLSMLWLLLSALPERMAAGSLLMLEAMWFQLAQLISTLWHLFFALLESNDVSPWFFFTSLAIFTVPYPNRAFVEVTKIIAKAALGLNQAWSYYRHQRDMTIKQLREQLADYVNPDVVEALKLAHESRVDELKKELENSKDEKKNLKTELDIAKSAVSSTHRKHEELELRLQELRNSPDLVALHMQGDEDHKALRKEKSDLATLKHEKGELEIQFSQAQDRCKHERESLIKQTRSEVKNLEDDQKATLRDKDRQIDQQAAQIDQQAAKIRALEMESESTAQCRHEVIDQQRHTIQQMEDQVAERDAEIQKLAQQTNFLDAFRNLVNVMISSGNETALATAIQFMFALKIYGVDLAQLGVDSHVFENFLKAVADKREGDLQTQANCLAVLEGNQEGSSPAFEPPTGLQMPGLEMEGPLFPNHFSGNTGFGSGQPIANQTMVPIQPDHDVGMLQAPQLTSMSLQGPPTPVVPPVNNSGGFLRGLLNPIPPPANSSGVIGFSMDRAGANPPRASNAVPPPANSSGVQGFTMNPVGGNLGGNLLRAANAVPPPAKSAGVQGFTMNPAPILSGIANMPWGMSSSSGGDASSSKSARSSRYSHGDHSLDY